MLKHHFFSFILCLILNSQFSAISAFAADHEASAGPEGFGVEERGQFGGKCICAGGGASSGEGGNVDEALDRVIKRFANAASEIQSQPYEPYAPSWAVRKFRDWGPSVATFLGGQFALQLWNNAGMNTIANILNQYAVNPLFDSAFGCEGVKAEFSDPCGTRNRIMASVAVLLPIAAWSFIKVVPKIQNQCERIAASVARQCVQAYILHVEAAHDGSYIARSKQLVDDAATLVRRSAELQALPVRERHTIFNLASKTGQLPLMRATLKESEAEEREVLRTLPESGDTCSICAMEFDGLQESARAMISRGCGHAFHASCLDAWKKVGGGAAAPCPNCRDIELPGTKDLCRIWEDRGNDCE
jgi:hypothetical protein